MVIFSPILFSLSVHQASLTFNLDHVNELGVSTEKKMHHLKFKNYVIFGALPRTIAREGSLSDIGNGGAKIYTNFY